MAVIVVSGVSSIVDWNKELEFAKQANKEQELNIVSLICISFLYKSILRSSILFDYVIILTYLFVPSSQLYYAMEN